MAVRARAAPAPARPRRSRPRRPRSTRAAHRHGRAQAPVGTPAKIQPRRALPSLLEPFFSLLVFRRSRGDPRRSRRTAKTSPPSATCPGRPPSTTGTTPPSPPPARGAHRRDRHDEPRPSQPSPSSLPRRSSGQARRSAAGLLRIAVGDPEMSARHAKGLALYSASHPALVGGE